LACVIVSIWGKGERTSGSYLTYLAVNANKKVSTAVALRREMCMLVMHNTSVLDL
jgi:hypothetical protein